MIWIRRLWTRLWAWLFDEPWRAEPVVVQVGYRAAAVQLPEVGRTKETLLKRAATAVAETVAGEVPFLPAVELVDLTAPTMPEWKPPVVVKPVAPKPEMRDIYYSTTEQEDFQKTVNDMSDTFKQMRRGKAFPKFIG